MKRQYVFAFTAGYLVSSAVASVVFNVMLSEMKKNEAKYKRLYTLGEIILTVVEEKEPELANDPRIQEFLAFEDIVKGL